MDRQFKFNAYLPKSRLFFEDVAFTTVDNTVGILLEDLIIQVKNVSIQCHTQDGYLFDLKGGEIDQYVDEEKPEELIIPEEFRLEDLICDNLAVYFNLSDVKLLQFTGKQDDQGHELFEGDTIIVGKELVILMIKFGEYKYLDHIHFGWYCEGDDGPGKLKHIIPLMPILEGEVVELYCRFNQEEIKNE